MRHINYRNVGKSSGQYKLSKRVLDNIRDLERQKRLACRLCNKTSYIEAKRQLLLIARYLQKCGLEVRLARVYENHYLYNITRKALMSQEV